MNWFKKFGGEEVTQKANCCCHHHRRMHKSERRLQQWELRRTRSQGHELCLRLQSFLCGENQIKQEQQKTVSHFSLAHMYFLLIIQSN